MADKKEYVIKQFRYFKAGDSRNSPKSDAIWIYSPDTENGDERKHLFSDINGSIVKLGIQGLPGTIFYINENILDQGIIIDHTGVYELDLKDTTLRLGMLYFDPQSLINISKVDNATLIVDILYEKS